MPLKTVETTYPLIDADPHASRVIRYFRKSDYLYIAGGAAVAPGALYFFEWADPTRHNLRPALRMAAVVGLCGGFLLAYQRSSFRFWGWSENAREQAMDFAELSQRAKEGKPLYGQSDMSEYNQGVAYRNSAFSQLKFAAFPWFNLVSHPHHGTDPAKYQAAAEPSSSGAGKL